MDFVDKKIMEYVINNSEDEPELLKELAKETYQKILQPRMLSCLLYTSPSPRDPTKSRMPSSA